MYILSGSRPLHRLPRWQDRHVHLVHDRYCPCRCGQCAFPNRRSAKLRPKWKTIDALYGISIDVEHPHTGNFAGRNADHGDGEARPPGPHLRWHP
jgi:hypothetical protein